MLKCVLDSTDMLKNFLPIFAANLVDGIKANKDRLESYIEKSPVLVTLLNPYIGYLTADRNLQGVAKDQQEYPRVGFEQRTDVKEAA